MAAKLRHEESGRIHVARILQCVMRSIMRGSMYMSAMWHGDAKCNDNLRLKEKRLRLRSELVLYYGDVESGCEFGGNKGR